MVLPCGTISVMNTQRRMFIIVSLAVMASLTYLIFSKPEPMYVYPVREQIVRTNEFISWDQWCWYEYDDQHVDKKYLGSYKLYANVKDDVRMSLSTCKSDNLVQ